VKYSGRILPKDVIKGWPEVFGEVHLNVLPLRYLHTVLVNFKDGKTWEIKITAKTRREGWDSFNENLADLISTYKENLDNIDFKLDTDRVKTDVQRSTQRFLKNKKL
jgi:hypothetical protein